MSIINRMRRERAVLWTLTGRSARGGVPTFTAPQEIDVRWEGKAELFIDADGEQAVSKGLVYVPFDIPVGSYLKYGELTGDEAPDPRNEQGATVIRNFAKLPDLRAKLYLRSVHI